MYPGETVDFKMAASHEAGQYWMRARTVGIKWGLYGQPDNITQEGWAIIDYDNTDDDPVSSYFTCTPQKQCSIFNCPFPVYPRNTNRKCISMAEAKSAEVSAELKCKYGLNAKKSEIIEKIYNFNFAWGSSVNAHKFVNPTVPLFQGITNETIRKCPVDCGKAAGCKCTFIDSLPLNEVVQLVFVNILPDAMFETHHGVHLHGHNFAVLKMGFPEHNETTGEWSKPTEDIVCDTNLCADAKWKKGHPKKMNLKNPPIKDNVMVPSRGYTVIRFKTDNPGFWLLHCHADIHLMEGMAMVLNEGGNYHPRLPKMFPTCGDFDWNEEEYNATQT